MATVMWKSIDGDTMDSSVETVQSGGSAYVVQTGSWATVSMTVCNSETGTAYTFSINIVPSGGSAAATNRIINTKTLAAGETRKIHELNGVILKAGDFIQVIGSVASKINYWGGIIERTN